MSNPVKVHLPGESLWAEVLNEVEGRIKARILNRPFHTWEIEAQREWTGSNFGTAAPLPKMHDHRQGDDLWFVRDEYGCWVPEIGGKA